MGVATDGGGASAKTGTWPLIHFFLSRTLVNCSHLIILCFVFFFCFAFLFIDPHAHMISRVNAKLTVIHCHVVFRLKTVA